MTSALIALSNPQNCDLCSRVLSAFGYTSQFCTGYDEFIQRLEESPNIVISGSSVGDTPVLDIIHEHPESHWIIQEQMSLASASILMLKSGCAGIVLDPLSESNLFDVIHFIHHSYAPNMHSGEFARYRWIRNSMDVIHATNSDGLMEVLDNNQNQQDVSSIQNIIESRFFTPSRSGSLSKTHISAILTDILKGKKTGTLDLRRSSLHWKISFIQGIPVDISTRDPHRYFDIESWIKRNGEHIEIRHNSGEYQTFRSRLSAAPDSTRLITSWIKTLLFEIFTWPDAEYSWKDTEKISVQFQSEMTEETMMQVIEKGIFEHMPLPYVLEVTQSCLPYFFKLKDNALGNHFSLSIQSKAIAEKLKKGDTLPEMLATFSVDYPVHQVVYFFLMMRHLDLNA